MRRLLLVGLAAFSSACAADSPAEPDLRSVRAPDGTGKPVYTVYELSVEWATGPRCCALGFDTLYFDGTGNVLDGGYRQPLYFGTRGDQAFGPFPFERGTTVTGELEGFRGGNWVDGGGSTLVDREGFSGLCSYAEQSRWEAEFGWFSFRCEYPDLIARETFTGTVQPNGTVVGTVDAVFGLNDVQFVTGTFTLTPIRGRQPAPPVVTYDLLEERSEFVVVGWYNDPITYPPYNVEMMVIAKGSDGTTIWTDEQYLDFDAPEGCVREGARIQCSGEVAFPLVIPVTILPGAEWYIAGTDIPADADFTGETVTVTFWTNPPE